MVPANARLAKAIFHVCGVDAVSSRRVQLFVCGQCFLICVFKDPALIPGCHSPMHSCIRHTRIDFTCMPVRSTLNMQSNASSFPSVLGLPVLFDGHKRSTVCNTMFLNTSESFIFVYFKKKFCNGIIGLEKGLKSCYGVV